MSRSVVAGVLAALVASSVPSVALAADGPEVCILAATETITAPRKPNLFNMKLNCGSEPTMEQESAVATVNSMTNTADAISYVASLGYELEGASTMVSYTGNAIISTFTMIKGGDDYEGGSMAPTSPFADEFDLPEAEDPFPIIPDEPEESEESEDDAMDAEDAAEESDEDLFEDDEEM